MCTTSLFYSGKVRDLWVIRSTTQTERNFYQEFIKITESKLREIIPNGNSQKALDPFLPKLNNIIISSVYGFSHSTGPTRLCR